MHDRLIELMRKPSLFEGFDTAALWTDSHVANVMLELHHDDATALASRPFTQIDSMSEWIGREVSIEGKELLDLGCGPGLYAERFQKLGAKVTGIDISETSIDHARSKNIPGAQFVVGSYHDEILPSCDITTLIYGDICAMPSDKRAGLFERVWNSLSAGGWFALDCFAPSAIADRQDEVIFELNMDGGFWAPEPYFGFKQTFVYFEETTVLDKYLIVEPERERWVHNWLQFMTPEMLTEELERAGFRAGEAKNVITGEPWAVDEDTFCVLAEKS